MFGVGPAELAIVAGIALLIVGPSQLPRLARAIRDTRRELEEPE